MVIHTPPRSVHPDRRLHADNKMMERMEERNSRRKKREGGKGGRGEENLHGHPDGVFSYALPRCVCLLSMSETCL